MAEYVFIKMSFISLKCLMFIIISNSIKFHQGIDKTLISATVGILGTLHRNYHLHYSGQHYIPVFIILTYYSLPPGAKLANLRVFSAVYYYIGYTDFENVFNYMRLRTIPVRSLGRKAHYNLFGYSIDLYYHYMDHPSTDDHSLHGAVSFQKLKHRTKVG